MLDELSPSGEEKLAALERQFGLASASTPLPATPVSPGVTESPRSGEEKLAALERQFGLTVAAPAKPAAKPETAPSAPPESALGRGAPWEPPDFALPPIPDTPASEPETGLMAAPRSDDLGGGQGVAPPHPASGPSMFSKDEQTGERGWLNELGASTVRGVAGIMKMPRAVANVFGVHTGEGMAESGEELEKGYAASPSISKGITESPSILVNPKWWASTLPSLAVQLIPIAIAALGGEVVAPALGVGAAAGGAIGGMAAGGVIGVSDAGERMLAWEKEHNQELPTTEKILIGLGAGTAGTFLPGMTLTKLVGKEGGNILASKVIREIFNGKTGQAIADRAVRSAYGGGAMAGFSVIENAFEKYGYNPDRELTQGVLESLITGTAISGIHGEIGLQRQKLEKARRLDEFFGSMTLDKERSFGSEAWKEDLTAKLQDALDDATYRLNDRRGVESTREGFPKIIGEEPPAPQQILDAQGKPAVEAKVQAALRKQPFERNAEEKLLADQAEKQGVDLREYLGPRKVQEPGPMATAGTAATESAKAAPAKGAPTEPKPKAEKAETPLFDRINENPPPDEPPSSASSQAGGGGTVGIASTPAESGEKKGFNDWIQEKSPERKFLGGIQDYVSKPGNNLIFDNKVFNDPLKFRLDKQELQVKVGNRWRTVDADTLTAWQEKVGMKATETPPTPPTPTGPMGAPGVISEDVGRAEQTIKHFTYAENIPSILEQGFDTSREPIHGTGANEGGKKTGKAAKDVLYFTTDTDRWGTAEVHVGEGNGDISRPAFDYDKQEWTEEKNAYKKVNLSALEASIKPEAKVLTIDSYQKALDFMGGALDKFEFIDNLVEKAKADGYDLVNLKNVDDAKWERPDGRTDKYDNKSWYGQLSGYSGKDDYFVINKEAIGLREPGREGWRERLGLDQTRSFPPLDVPVKEWTPVVAEIEKKILGTDDPDRNISLNVLSGRLKADGEARDKLFAMISRLGYNPDPLYAEDLIDILIEANRPEYRARGTARDSFKEAAALGNKGVAKTADGTKVPYQWGVVELDDMVASHDHVNLEENPKYPQELQPRDREAAPNELELANLQNIFDTDYPFVQTPSSSSGAPILGPDMLMESGNGRTIIFRRFQTGEDPRWPEYRQKLMEKAEEYGIDPAAIKDMENPALVRIRTNKISAAERRELVKKMNVSEVGKMGDVEYAKLDARELADGTILDLFNPEFGLETGENKDFRSAFIGRIVGSKEAKEYLTDEGGTNDKGYARIRRALFALAYKSPDALERLASKMDDPAKNITDALLRVAPRVAKIDQEIGKGNLYPLSISENMAEAAGIQVWVKENVANVPAGMDAYEYYLKQKGLFDQPAPETLDILALYQKYKGAPKRLADIFTEYLKTIERAGNPKQPDMFGATAVPDKDSILDAAIRLVERKYGTEEKGLYGLRATPAAALDAGAESPIGPSPGPGGEGGPQGQGPPLGPKFSVRKGGGEEGGLPPGVKEFREKYGTARGEKPEGLLTSALDWFTAEKPPIPKEVAKREARLKEIQQQFKDVDADKVREVLRILPDEPAPIVAGMASDPDLFNQVQQANIRLEMQKKEAAGQKEKKGQGSLFGDEPPPGRLFDVQAGVFPQWAEEAVARGLETKAIQERLGKNGIVKELDFSGGGGVYRRGWEIRTKEGFTIMVMESHVGSLHLLPEYRRMGDPKGLLNPEYAEKGIEFKPGNVLAGAFQPLKMGNVVNFGALVELARGEGPRTLDHEFWHMIERYFLTDKERSKIIKKYGVNEEDRANAYMDWDPKAAPDSVFQKILDFAKTILKAITGYETAEDIFAKARSGELYKQTPRKNPLPAALAPGKYRSMAPGEEDLVSKGRHEVADKYGVDPEKVRFNGINDDFGLILYDIMDPNHPRYKGTFAVPLPDGPKFSVQKGGGVPGDFLLGVEGMKDKAETRQEWTSKTPMTYKRFGRELLKDQEALKTRLTSPGNQEIPLYVGERFTDRAGNQIIDPKGRVRFLNDQEIWERFYKPQRPLINQTGGTQATPPNPLVPPEGAVEPPPNKRPGWLEPMRRSLKEKLSVNTISNLAKYAHQSLVEHMGWAAREGDKVGQVLDKYSPLFDKMDQDALNRFTDIAEDGEKNLAEAVRKGELSPEHLEAAQAWRRLSDGFHFLIADQKGGQFSYWTDYFPRMAKNPEMAQEIISQYLASHGRRGGGAASFLEARKILKTSTLFKPRLFMRENAGGVFEVVKRDLYGDKDAVVQSFDSRADAETMVKEKGGLGLEPIDANYVTMMKANLWEKARWLMDNYIKNDLGETGFLSTKKQSGWVPVADKGIWRGNWAHPDVASVIEKHLSPGMRGDPLFKAYYEPFSAMNEAFVAFSAFHASFSTLSYFSHGIGMNLPRAIGSALRGDFNAMNFHLGQLAKTANLPGSLIEAGNYIAQWKNPQAHPEIEFMVDLLQRGGGRVKADAFSKVSQSFADALAENKVGLPRQVIKAMAWPIMNWLVPRFKIIAQVRRLEAEIFKAKQEGRTLSRDDFTALAQQVTREGDNIFGQMVYDNLGMKRGFKDLLGLYVGFPGWNLGSLKIIKEAGMGAVHLIGEPGRFIAEALTGGKPKWRSMTREQRMGVEFMVGMTLTMAVGSAIIQRLLAGEWPKDAADLFMPRTGSLLHNGEPERMRLPTYMRDVLSLNHPVSMIQHKMAFPFRLASELVNNQDYFGTQIRDPWASTREQAGQTLDFVGRSLLPFGVQGVMNTEDPRARWLNVAGLTKVPREYTNTPALQIIDEYNQLTRATTTTKETAAMKETKANLTKLARAGDADGFQDAAEKAVGEGKLTRQQVKEIVKDSQQPLGMSRFTKLPLEWALRVWGAASDHEKQRWQPYFLKKVMGEKPEILIKHRESTADALDGMGMKDAADAVRNLTMTEESKEFDLSNIGQLMQNPELADTDVLDQALTGAIENKLAPKQSKTSMPRVKIQTKEKKKPYEVLGL